jgi:hypothetical protein
MEHEAIKFSTRIPLQNELFFKTLRELKKEKKQVNWLLAAAFLALFTLNITACLFVVKKEQQSTGYLIKTEYYE